MGLKIVALVAVTILLVVASSASVIAVAGDGDGKGNYWWEDSSLDCLTPYEQGLVKEIIVLIFDRYFGIDVSRMTVEEMDEVGRLIGPEGQERYIRLFKEYAQRKGFEIPEPPCDEPIVAPPAEEIYWWEMMGDNPERTVEGMKGWIAGQVAEARGVCPSEVEARFEEFFPGVDLWRMTGYEFQNFLNSLPRPPLRPVCFDKLRQNPYIIAVFGRVPAFSTEQELREFDETLAKVLLEADPLLRKLPSCEFPLQSIHASQGAIHIQVHSDQLAGAEKVYEIIAEKAETVFGIEHVPVIFYRAGPFTFDWSAPWNEAFPRIPGAVKVTSDDAWPMRASTTSFAVEAWRWWRFWDFWDQDYIITGHKGPSNLWGLPTITPLGMRVNQPPPTH